MPTVEDVRKSVGDTGSDGGGLLLQGPAGAGAALGLDGDVLLDYTERVQSFFPECKELYKQLRTSVHRRVLLICIRSDPSVPRTSSGRF